MLARRLLMVASIALLITGLMAGCSDADGSGSPTGPSRPNAPYSGNRAPEAVGIIPVQYVDINEPTQVSVARYFWDPDGDELDYAATSSDPDVITASASGATITLTTGIRPGQASVSVTATDPGNLTATQALRYRGEAVIYPSVWSQNGFDGEGYEYVVICNNQHELAMLETCFLWNLTAVRVERPDGRIFDLDKDFNIQSYSGEVTRRWVLYSPAGAGFPQSGDYTFRYYIGNTLEYEHVVAYTLKTVGFPTNVGWRREGDDLVIEWTPPKDGEPGMTGKAILFTDAGETISELYTWGTERMRLRDIPLRKGTTGRITVTVVFRGGYAYSEYVPLIW